jgi:hypothetical protein
MAKEDPPPTKETPKPSWGSQLKDVLASPVALLAIIGFAIMAIWMLQNLSLKEPEWTRATLVYGSVEAIAFAAVGYLFGKEVHREQAQSAEANAKDAKADAKAKADEAEKAKVGAESAKTKNRDIAMVIDEHVQKRKRLVASGASFVTSETTTKADLVELEISDLEALRDTAYRIARDEGP